VSTLTRFKVATTLGDVAKILGFTSKGLSYILYKIPPDKKYRTFTIPKKTGGTRTIQAPGTHLALLQERLAENLYDCVAEIQRENPRYWIASHGFQKNKTIVSNAAMHKRRRFVFNVDIENFFGSINFGRVRGFFIRDKAFSLHPTVATIIAQIACHENALPQGSPCSPVISNFIGNILDLRLIALARDARCTYTRYADDLTFSTNEMLFPSEIAVNIRGSEWIIGEKLRREIENAGFTLNDRKTRMSLRRSRQTVTGLVVNAKPNISQDYWRYVRAMCHALFSTGQYQRSRTGASETISSLDPLEGMLSHIYFVKARKDRRPKANKLAEKAGEFRPPKAPMELYKRFLFYKHFVAPTAPVIVTEGVSDIIYLECAIRALAKLFPSLVEEEDGLLKRLVKFLRPSATTRDVLNLGHGASGQASLISQYTNEIKRYGHRPVPHPVIVLCDNDGGAKNVLKIAREKYGLTVKTSSTDPFYHLCENLYIVKIPEGNPPKEREIEELFQPALLATTIDGKPFDPKKEHGDDTAYGKVKFAEEVVRPNTDSIDFSGFEELLSRIDQCLAHYYAKKASTTKPAAAAATS
jgi:hypothetical protein